jgi:uncharacterized protein DUF4190
VSEQEPKPQGSSDREETTEPQPQYPPPQGPPAQPSGYLGPPPHYPPPQQQLPGYPPAYYVAQPVPTTGTNGFAIASLVLGILWLWWVGSVLALVFGYVGKNQIERSGGAQGGRGMAIAGIVLGWVGIGVLILAIVLVAIGAAAEPY